MHAKNVTYKYNLKKNTTQYNKTMHLLSSCKFVVFVSIGIESNQIEHEKMRNTPRKINHDAGQLSLPHVYASN